MQQVSSRQLDPTPLGSVSSHAAKLVCAHNKEGLNQPLGIDCVSCTAVEQVRLPLVPTAFTQECRVLSLSVP